ncbi:MULTISPECIES: hypothetical protein [unclassified Microcoleus]|uniref:hypothetical protein n=1 Tax=unclassified Microcoleus TaxID=2642155 RepID=UPI002FD58077
MSSFKRFPTSVRYLIARLRHWTQPAVWAPLAVLCAGGLFIWEVSVHPERLSIDGEEVAASNNQASLPGLSAEDSAIAAEIDSLPVLINQFNQSNSELSLLNSSVVKGPGLFNEINAGGSEKSQPSSAMQQQATSRLLTLPNLANPDAGFQNNNPLNSSLPSSNAASALSLSGSGAIVSGIKTIGFPESAGTATSTLSQQSSGANSGKQNDAPLALSPLQAAMQKYLATNTSATATSTENTASSAQLLDRPASSESPANPANLLPAAATAQGRANPVNVPVALPSVAIQTNIIGESPQFLNPTATTPESSARLNSRVPSLGEINTAPATVAMPKNPYQTNLYGSGVAPEVQPAALPAVVPGPIPLLPNVRQSSFPSAIGESKIINPQVSPNSANSEFQPAQSNQLNLPGQPNFGAVPQNNNNQGQQIQPQPFSTPRSLTPGRYIGGGEINTFANP